jgi:hypothetical protein
MSDVLLVPIKLDALCLETDLSVVEPKVDFSRLPYWDGTRHCEINPDVANISEALLAQPLEDRGLQLQRGVHLHWALPDALTRGEIAADGTRFPAVPNRWLVTRRRDTVERQWIVESDFLHPDQKGASSGSIVIPFPADKDQPPFRYLGRKIPFADWTEGTAGNYLAGLGYHLTAIGYHRTEPDSGKSPGYGEPTFAALYPNCHSVFGLHDADVFGPRDARPPASLLGVKYDVIGWYSDPEHDCLRTIETRAKATEKTLEEALKEVYQWTVNQGKADAKGIPTQTLFYACLTIGVDPPTCKRDDNKPVTIAVGNTATEALSAYVANTLGGPNEHGQRAPHLQNLEAQLEALHLAARLGNRKLDIGAKFEEARHERGFTAVPSGTLWVIRQKMDAANGEARQETLPDELAHLLNRLNVAQTECDQAGQALESMQKQLFADWYKYMVCAYPPDEDDYPDIDEVRYFIEKNDLLPILRQQWKRRALQLQCLQLQGQMVPEVVSHGMRTKKTYELQPVSAPRYWRPHEPVLLIVDQQKEMQPIPRYGYGQDGRLLACGVHPVKPGGIKEKLAELGIEFLKANADTWTKQPWHPFILEWRVELSPLAGQNNLDPQNPVYGRNNLDSQNRAYGQDFITSNYQWRDAKYVTTEGKTAAVDLAHIPGKDAVQQAESVFTGSSLLTPHAKFQLQAQIEAFLAKKPNVDDQVVKAIQEVKKELNSDGFHALAQSLSGFNEALLMHKQTLQLPIAEPLGSEAAQEFTAAVRDAVGPSNLSAPQPFNDFHPIRSGVLRIDALRVVDTFGRVQNLTLQDGKVIATEVMTIPDQPHLVWLPPRLVQPARLNFRWLAADRGDSLADVDEPEMNTHPATTPVCGWLVPNNLDRSLMVYDSSGQALGSISAKERKWIPAPGTSMLPYRLPNAHLKTLIHHLLNMPRGSESVTSLEKFLSGIDDALERIDPENFAQHQALALLMGRPLAVVRALVNLELRGQPAVNQHWNEFRNDIERDLQGELTRPDSERQEPAQRTTDDFAKVRFPIRLGADLQLNDGLVGFWREEPSGGGTYVYKDFHFAKDPSHLEQAIDGPAQKFTMLVDPRGLVHASCGILPAKAIGIPPDQYAKALQTLAVTFLTAPILTGAGEKLRVPLPAEPGHAWSWLEKRKGIWAESIPGPVSLEATFAEAPTIREGWLKLTKIEEGL